MLLPKLDYLQRIKYPTLPGIGAAIADPRTIDIGDWNDTMLLKKDPKVGKQ